MQAQLLRRYRADRLLDGQFHALRPRVTSVVRARLRACNVKLDRADLDACYAQAWHALYAALLAGEQIADHAGWLVVVTFRRAVEESRSRKRQIADLTYEPAQLDGRSASWSDPAAELDRRVLVRHLFEAVRARFTSRERQLITLCYLHGLSRAEAAARIGIGTKRMRKLMDGSRDRPGVARRFGQLLEEVRVHGWCERQGSLMRAHALGLHDPDGERHRLAQAHLRECPACRAFVACLRGLAIVLPPLPLPPAGPSPFAPRPRARARARLSARMALRARPMPRARARAAFGRAPTLAKLATVGALGLAGGGYAVLAGSAPGRTTHTTPSAPVVTPTAMRPHPSRHTKVHRLSRHTPRHKLVVSPVLPSAKQAGTPHASPVKAGPLAQEAAPPPGEFTPERPPRR
jgi:DNA-directed RNA polymerase specialized sigma24 family protein